MWPNIKTTVTNMYNKICLVGQGKNEHHSCFQMIGPMPGLESANDQYSCTYYIRMND